MSSFAPFLIIFFFYRYEISYLLIPKKRLLIYVIQFLFSHH
ncbi:hypothetical protein HMPREF1870_01431 [Bacteroidales bacterium KA00344]|nr:hypothetical protein HMPREF1870_01431 [Bacteroidales bacterium KA00344]